MLFTQRFLDGIADGTITLAFRRWRRPTVRAGGQLRTAIGVLAIDAVDVIVEADITEPDARSAGYASLQELLASLNESTREALPPRRSKDGPDALYRITLRLAGADPRAALRERDTFTDEEQATLSRRLSRLDAASRHGAWTEAVLRTIAEQPGVRAAKLAAALGRDTPSFKLDVRKLKELGLTESLEIGYRLSPRGRAWMERIVRD